MNARRWNNDDDNNNHNNLNNNNNNNKQGLIATHRNSTVALLAGSTA